MEIYDLLTEFENGYEENVPEEFPMLRNKKSMETGYYDDAINYLSSFSGFGNYKILAVEEKFDVLINDFIFNGVIDLILEDNDGNIIIMDHKSKKTFANDDEEKKYKRQLYLYAYYIRERFGKFPTQLKFNMFRNLEIKTYEFIESEFDEAVKWMFESVEMIRQIYCGYNYFFCQNLCSAKLHCGAKKEVESNKCLSNYIKKNNKEKVNDIE